MTASGFESSMWPETPQARSERADITGCRSQIQSEFEDHGSPSRPSPQKKTRITAEEPITF